MNGNINFFRTTFNFFLYRFSNYNKKISAESFYFQRAGNLGYEIHCVWQVKKIGATVMINRLKHGLFYKVRQIAHFLLLLSLLVV